MTILEVLIAFAIFLFSLAAIAQLVDLGSRSARETIDQNTGTRLAQSKLAEVEAGVIAPSAGGSGTFDDEPDWQWSVESGGSPVPNVYDVTVRVWREVGANRFEVTLAQMVCDPLQMGTAAAAVSPTTTTTTETTTTTATGTGS
jgi:Tfp pilus assembly protein PilV